LVAFATSLTQAQRQIARASICVLGTFPVTPCKFPADPCFHDAKAQPNLATGAAETAGQNEQNGGW
jgi:hypothetical protein